MPERRLWAAARRGELLDLRSPHGAEPNRIWGASRSVRASVIAELLISGPAPIPGKIGAVRLAGARITGTFDVSHADVVQPVELLECWFDEPVHLNATHAKTISLRGCRIPGLSADGLRTEGELDLKDLVCSAAVDLTDAHLAGPLVLSGAQLSNPDGSALSADGLTVDNDVFCRNGFQATGEVRLLGARIDGDLDLTDAALDNPTGDALHADSAEFRGSVLCTDGFRAAGKVSLNRCEVGGDVDFTDAVLTNPDGAALHCDGATVHGSVAGRGSITTGEISLLGAQIDGQIGLSGAVLSNPGGDAFSGDGLHARTGMFCRDGLQVTGRFRLPGARIGGQLSFGTATLSNPGDDAFTATKLVVEGNAQFSDGFSATGEVCLLAAHIQGQLNFSGAVLDNPDADALLADESTVDASLNFRDGFDGRGSVSLKGARIGGDIGMEGASLAKPGDDTLSAQGMEVSGSVYCRYGFTSVGRVDLSGVRIGGQLSLRSAVLRNPGQSALVATLSAVGADVIADGDLAVHGTLDLSRLTVTGDITVDASMIDGAGKTAVDLAQTTAQTLYLNGMSSGRIRLNNANFRVVSHEPEDWPTPGALSIDGLSYTSLRPAEVRAAQWLRWLHRALPDGYRPQPYEQLARVLRRGGRDHEARVVQLAKQRHRRASLPWHSKPWGWVQDVTVGYGYVPWRAAGWLGFFWLSGCAYFSTQHPISHQDAGTTGYQPALYTLDLILPMLNLGQRNVWQFSAGAQIAALLISAGAWILGITVLAGLTRALTRN